MFKKKKNKKLKGLAIYLPCHMTQTNLPNNFFSKPFSLRDMERGWLGIIVCLLVLFSVAHVPSCVNAGFPPLALTSLCHNCIHYWILFLYCIQNCTGEVKEYSGICLVLVQDASCFLFSPWTERALLTGAINVLVFPVASVPNLLSSLRDRCLFSRNSSSYLFLCYHSLSFILPCFLCLP